MINDRRKSVGAAGRHVASNIRRLRKTAGMSQQQLADSMTRLGFPMGQSSLARKELGQNPITADELAAFAHVLGVPAGDLFAEAPSCPACQDNPPPGYQCLTCRREG